MNCETAPGTETYSFTAVVSGRTYLAEPSDDALTINITATSALFPFPGLTVTSLNRGDQIVMVIQANLNVVFTWLNT